MTSPDPAPLEMTTSFRPLSALPVAAVHEVNTLALEFLIEAARHRDECVSGLNNELKRLLKATTAAGIHRAARRFFLLVDLRFRDTLWWQSALQPPNKSTRSPGSHPILSRRQSSVLARSTLVLAWNITNANPHAAAVMFGMSREVASLIATASISELDRLADRYARWIGLRWFDRPAFWHALLEGARADDEAMIHQVDLHAMQLLSGDLLVQRPSVDRC